MAAYGFMTPGWQEQPQLSDLAAGYPAGLPPPGPGAQDPQSAYLQRALQTLGQRPQADPMGLDASLLAEALDRYALKARQGTPGGMGDLVDGAANRQSLQPGGLAGVTQGPMGIFR